MAIKDIYRKAHEALSSRKGRNALAFCIFLIISAFLWCVIALNDEGQTDLRLPVSITHIPDSVTMVSKVPATMNVAVVGRGSQLLKYSIGKAPEFKIDFRLYKEGSMLHLSPADLKGIARNTLGGAQVLVIAPDSLNLAFTSNPPALLPVKLDFTATPGPQATLSGKPSVSPDSVKVYVAGGKTVSVSSISTEPLRLEGVNETTTRRVALITPSNTKVVPDSVNVTINAEALIFKTRKVRIEPINVPFGERLITFPSQVDVMYMIPVSEYLDVEPKIRVVADYHSITPATGRVRIRIAEASGDLSNVHVAVDSVEYIIEKLH